MSLKEFIKEHNREEVAYYLLDATTWAYFSSQEGNPHIVNHKTTFFNKKKVLLVFVNNEEEDLRERYKQAYNAENTLDYVEMRPKPALEYIIECIGSIDLDGVLFNGCYFLSFQNLIDMYKHHLPKYCSKNFKEAMKITDSSMQTYQYLKAFIYSPVLYFIRDKATEKFVYVITNLDKVLNKEQEPIIASPIFSSSAKAKEFAFAFKLKNVQIVPYRNRKPNFIFEKLCNSYFVLIDNKGMPAPDYIIEEKEKALKNRSSEQNSLVAFQQDKISLLLSQYDKVNYLMIDNTLTVTNVDFRILEMQLLMI